MLVTGSIAQFKAATLAAGATTLLVTELLGNVTTVAVKTSVGWIAWAITGTYARATFDVDFAGFAVYEATGISI